MTDVLVGTEWIVVEESATDLEEKLRPHGTREELSYPLESWILLTLPAQQGHSQRQMKVAVSAITAVRWHVGDE